MSCSFHAFFFQQILLIPKNHIVFGFLACNLKRKLLIHMSLRYKKSRKLSEIQIVIGIFFIPLLLGAFFLNILKTFTFIVESVSIKLKGKCNGFFFHLAERLVLKWIKLCDRCIQLIDFDIIGTGSNYHLINTLYLRFI